MSVPPFPDPRAGPPYHMIEMIEGQPGALRRALQLNALAFGPAADRLLGARRVYLAGCGSSFHACLVGAFALRWALPAPMAVAALQAFELAAYPPPLEGGDVLVAATQSGETAATVRALRWATAAGAAALVVTAAPGSTAARLATEVLLQGKERDRSWATTLGYTTQLALLLRLALVAARRAGTPGLDELDFALNGMPEAVKQVLRLGPAIEALARGLAPRERFLFVGGGPNVATAAEGALKVAEAAYGAAEAWEVEQIAHGPLFSCDRRCAAFLLLPPGPARSRGLAVARALRAAGATVVALGERGDGEAEAAADAWLPLPPTAELLSPLPYVVPLQLFTYHFALLRGLNPDPLRTADPAYREAAALLFER